jgi:tetratricopeptide (TPR) repeat protein
MLRRFFYALLLRHPDSGPSRREIGDNLIGMTSPLGRFRKASVDIMIGKRLFNSSNPMEIARAHCQAGRLDEANAICREVLRTDSQNADAFHVLGVAELKAHRPLEAIELIGRALARNPNIPSAQIHLGDAYLELEDLDQARSCYKLAMASEPDDAAAHNSLGVTFAIEQRAREAAACFSRAVQIEPEWAIPHFNLGLSLKEQLQTAAAAREFAVAWHLDPMMPAAMHECVGAAAAWARVDSGYRSASTLQMLPQVQSFSIIFCSIDDAKFAYTVGLYRRLFDDVPHELIPIRDARSLAEAYNRGIASSTGDIVLLSHDDVDILTSDFARRLQAHLSRFDVVGVMGAAEMSGPTWNWSRHPHLRGWITHHLARDADWRPFVVDPRPVAGDVVVLDGVLIAAHRKLFDKVKFDEETFDGFHLYDTDWSYRAAKAGFRMAAAGDLLVVHASGGRYDVVWEDYAHRFCDKHSLGEMSPPPPLHVGEASLRNADEVRAFFGRLTDLDAECRPGSSTEP